MTYENITIAEMQFTLSGYVGYLDGDKKIVIVNI